MKKEQKTSLRAKRSNLSKIILGIVALALVGFGVWKYQSSKVVDFSAKPTVKIGVIYPMSGDGAIYGEAAKDTVKMFFEDFNKKDHNFNYEVLFEDNQLKPARNAVLANKLTQVDKVDWLITCLSNFGMVVSPIAEKNETFHFSVATDPAVANGFYNFMASSNVEEEAQKLYDNLIKNNAKNVEIVLFNATGPESMTKHFEQVVEKEKGLNINATHKINPGEKDFRTLIAKISNNNPDYVVVMLQMPEIDVFLKQYKDAGVKLPFTGIETFTYLQNKELAEGQWYVDAAVATNDFEEKYSKFTGRNTTDYAEYMDMMLQVITNAYENVGNKDKLAIGKYVQKNSNGLDTALGRVSAYGDGIISGKPVLRKVENGKLVTVKE